MSVICQSSRRTVSLSALLLPCYSFYFPTRQSLSGYLLGCLLALVSRCLILFVCAIPCKTVCPSVCLSDRTPAFIVFAIKLRGKLLQNVATVLLFLFLFIFYLFFLSFKLPCNDVVKTILALSHTTTQIHAEWTLRVYIKELSAFPGLLRGKNNWLYQHKGL